MNCMTSTAAFAAATQSLNAGPVIDRGGDNWSEAQVLLLASLVRVERLSTASIAVQMGRTESSISTAVSRYAVRDPRAQLRPCMPCGRKFFSMHIGNRICARCRVRNDLESA
jgi:hypothetical protein